MVEVVKERLQPFSSLCIVSAVYRAQYQWWTQCQKPGGRFLDAEGMVEVVKELRRLLPGAEPGQVLRSDPSWLLRCGHGCFPAPSARHCLRSCSRASCPASADHSGCFYAAAYRCGKDYMSLIFTCLLPADVSACMRIFIC